MLKPEQVRLQVDDRLDLVVIVRLLRQYKLTVILTAVICAVLAAAYALLATPIFRAEVTITPVHDRGQGNGSLASQFGSLASLAGVSLQDPTGEEQQAKAVLGSRYLIQKFIERYDLLPVLSRRSPKPLSMWKGVNLFHDGVVSVRDDQRKGVTIVGINWIEPAVAARWANDFVAMANELVRNKALTDAKRNVDYLTAQAARTSSIEVQRALYDLLEAESKKLMLANERTEYAFAVADPAVAPELRTSPKRTLIVLFALGFGIFLGAMIAFMRARFAQASPHADR